MLHTKGLHTVLYHTRVLLITSSCLFDGILSKNARNRKRPLSSQLCGRSCRQHEVLLYYRQMFIRPVQKYSCVCSMGFTSSAVLLSQTQLHKMFAWPVCVDRCPGTIRQVITRTMTHAAAGEINESIQGGVPLFLFHALSVKIFVRMRHSTRKSQFFKRPGHKWNIYDYYHHYYDLEGGLRNSGSRFTRQATTARPATLSPIVAATCYTYHRDPALLGISQHGVPQGTCTNDVHGLPTKPSIQRVFVTPG